MAACGRGGDGDGDGDVVGTYFGGSRSTNALVQNKSPLEPFFLSAGSSSSFFGSSSMVSFEDVCGGGKRSGRPFFCTFDQEENGDDDFDEYLHQPEKKRRLTIEQVQFLEKSFETENKLEPERKVQLAKELGLQPRQVAIWFQNRRARWKTKQMEKDFDTLQASYNNLKSDYEQMLKEKEKLKAEVAQLSDKLQLKEQDQGSNDSEPYNLFNQSKTVQLDLIVESASETNDQHISIFGYRKQDDPSSAKSDVIDSDSPHVVEAAHSAAFAEPGSDSSYAFEADQSDISQDDEDCMNNSLLPSSHDFSKIEEVDPSDNTCQFGISGDDHAYLLWSCSI